MIKKMIVVLSLLGSLSACHHESTAQILPAEPPITNSSILPDKSTEQALINQLQYANDVAQQKRDEFDRN